MGMGLAICRTIMAAHGGRIWLEQTGEPGALFHFELPLVETPRQRDHAAVTARDERGIEVPVIVWT